jgi:hypothetical protein
MQTFTDLLQDGVRTSKNVICCCSSSHAGKKNYPNGEGGLTQFTVIPDGVTAFFHYHNPSGHTMALGSTQHPTEMSTRNISWG